jgi:hypothetical protein
MKNTLFVCKAAIVLFTVRNFFQLLTAVTLGKKDDAMEEQYFSTHPHQTPYWSSNNTLAQDIEARRNGTVNMGKPISPMNQTIATSYTSQTSNSLIDKSVKIATKKHTKFQKRIILTNVTLKIPTPVLLASLPKSGTTSIWRYFLRGGQSASHNVAQLNETWSNKTVLGTGDKVNGAHMVSGECMKWNALAGRPFLEGCGDYNVWTDTGSLTTRQDQTTVCYYPGIEGLDEWYKSYPNSTIILTTRSVKSWVHSASTWGGGGMVMRWDSCNLTGFVGQKSTELAQFYNWHLDLVRDFARRHPSITYIEALLEDPDIASILHAKTGIPSSCWGDSKPKAHRRSSRVKVPNEMRAA